MASRPHRGAPTSTLLSRHPHGDNSTRYTARGIQLKPGDVLRVKGIPDGSDPANLDYIEVAPPASPRELIWRDQNLTRIAIRANYLPLTMRAARRVAAHVVGIWASERDQFLFCRAAARAALAMEQQHLVLIFNAAVPVGFDFAQWQIDGDGQMSGTRIRRLCVHR